MVFFIKAPPTKPPTWRQRFQRNRFRLCGKAWQAIQPAARAAWEAATKNAGLRCTGYNLFTYWQLTLDTPRIKTVERYAHIDIPGI